MSKTTKGGARIFTTEDVVLHNKEDDCWVVFEGKVYDVTGFLQDHPGGDDLITDLPEPYASTRDVTELMSDPTSHSHSDSAFALLTEYQIGVLVTGEQLVDPNFEWKDDFKPRDTETSGDWERNRFLDLDRPLVMQMLTSDFSKSFYLQQVHQPRHLPVPATFFSQWYLEALTRTPWYVVPIIWLPITFYLGWSSLNVQSLAGVDATKAGVRTLIGFLIGNFVWTILEYTMHRFLFHIEYYLPDNRFALSFHFLTHGVHHYLPMDRLRLVMPPLLFFVLQYPFTKLAWAIFPRWLADAGIAGAFFFYVMYDETHYALHHTKLPAYIKKLKSHHMQHHYKEPNMGFGVTSWFWDWVFGTEFVGVQTINQGSGKVQ